MPGPGVSVTTGIRSGASGASVAPSGQAFFVGLAERGDTAAPVLVRSLLDVRRYLGLRPAYGTLYDNLKLFFDEGGSQAWVQRVVGATASKGTLTLQDKAGTPVNTLRVDAQNPGDWSSRLTVEVQAGSAPNTFRIILRMDGDVVEDQNNMASPAEAVAKFSKSPFVRLTDLASATASPNNIPKVLAATALSAGNDQRASVAASDYVNALALFPVSLGDGAVAIPGQTGATIFNGLTAHAVANRRVAILSGALGDSKSTLLSTAAGLDNDAAGLFGPFVIVSDGGYGTRTISPEGFVMACRSRAHEAAGPWKSPAGEIGKARTILGLQTEWTAADLSDFNDGKVSIIRTVQGSPRLYNWRSLSNNTDNFFYLKDRDTLNRIVTLCEQALEQFVHLPIDARGKLLSSVNAEIRGVVEPIRLAGGLFERFDDQGREVDPGYKVNTGQSINPLSSLQQNMLAAELGVRLSPSAGLIALTVTKVGLTAAL